MSLVLATAIWLLIRKHLEGQGEWIEERTEDEAPPKARIVTPEELRQEQEEQLAAAISLMVKQYLREQEPIEEAVAPVEPAPDGSAAAGPGDEAGKAGDEGKETSQ